MEELLARVSSAELTEWLAYRQIEPLPDERRDVLLATLAAILTNANRDPASSEAMTAKDFLPWLDEEDDRDQAQSPEEMLALVEQLNAAFGGTDLRKPGVE